MLSQTQCAKILSMIKAFAKFCALILGSGLFFPFSCTSSFIAGAFLFVELDARDLTKGEMPFPGFDVGVVSVNENRSVVFFPLDRIHPSYKDKDSYYDLPLMDTSQYSFLLPYPEGKLNAQEWRENGYKVSVLSPGKQLIEVYANTADYRFTHVYLAEENKIEPLRSKIFGLNQAFKASALAPSIGLGLYGFGIWLRRKCYPQKIPAALQYTTILIILGALVSLYLGIQIPLQSLPLFMFL